MAIATISTIKDKLNLCSLEQSIQAYRDAKNKRNTHGINNINSRNNKRQSYANNTRRSYANERRHSFPNSAGHSYANNTCPYTRRSYARETRPFIANSTTHAYANDERRRADTNNTRPIPASDTPRVYANEERDSDENIFITTPLGSTLQIPVEVRKVQNGATIPHKEIPHTKNIPHSTVKSDTRSKRQTTDYNTRISENQSAPAATTNKPQINEHTKPSGMHEDQHTTIIPTTPRVQTQSPTAETHHKQHQEQEPQLTIAIDAQKQKSIKENMSCGRTLMDTATFDLIRQKSPERQEPPIYSQHQNSLNNKKNNEHTRVDELVNDAALNIVGQKRGKRTKPCRFAIQILQQDTRNDNIKYLMR